MSNYVPCDYYDDDDLDDDDFGDYEAPKPQVIVLTEEQKRAIKLRNVFNDANSGNTESVLECVDEGLSVDTILQDDYTLIFLAAVIGNVDLFNALIKRGADIHQTRNSDTLLMAAANCPKTTAPYERSYEIAKKLIDLKVEANKVNRKRQTAFMLAAGSGNVGIVNLLLPWSDKNAVDNQGWTALFWAVSGNYKDVAQILLNAGVDYTKMDVRRLSALDYASQNGYYGLSELFPNNKQPDQFEVTCSHYTFHDIVERKFMPDVLLMLRGMKCEALQSTFYENQTNLLDFLTLDRGKLSALGIIKPYQQNRILGGLYRFHKQPYKYKSIPIKNRNEIFTTFDVAECLFSTTRHIVTMQATLRYLIQHADSEAKRMLIAKYLVTLKERVATAQRTVKQLNKKVLKWDEANAPVDLITYKSSYNLGFKLLPFIPLVIIIVIKKMQVTV